MAELPPMPDTWPEQRIYIGKIQYLGCHNLIQDILKDKPETTLHYTLGRLIEKTQEENHILAFRNDVSIPQFAWAVRNAMELRVFIRFVLQSQTNLERFNNDLLINGVSSIRTSLELLNAFAKMVPDPMRPSAEQYRNLGEMQQARKEAGLSEQGPLMARTCAKGVGLEKEYLAFSTVTSMLIHPTALSVLKTFSLDVFEIPLTGQGLVLIGDTILDIRKHVERYGFRPESKR